MKLRFVVAVVIIAVAPCALAQQSGKPKPTAADARQVVKIVSGNKTRLQAYCDLAKIGDQIQQAMQAKDAAKSAELAGKSDALAQQVGPEFIALMDGLTSLDENSSEGDAIDKTLDELDKQCTK